MTRGHGRLDPTAAKKDAGNRKLPALIYIHGGGWVAGEKDVKHIYLSKFAEHGYFVVNIEYDLAPERIFLTPLVSARLLRTISWIMLRIIL